MKRNQGEWLTVVVGLILAACSLSFFIFVISQNWDFSTLTTASGLPLAPDFSNYWSAAKIALAGKPAATYNLSIIHEVQHQFFGTSHYPHSGWYYPPTFLLMVLPLGLMPYLAALFTWLILTLVLYLWVLSRLSHHPIILPLAVAFPGICQNFLFGQNGFLSGLLLGGGLVLLDRAPQLAGCLLGLLSYKPHFVVLVLFALLCGRRWKALLAAALTSLTLLLASLAMFGYGTWMAYVKVMSIPMGLLEMGAAAWSIMPTFFAAMLSANFGVGAAYLVQGLVMLAVVGGVAWVWTRNASPAPRGAVLVLGVLLFTPYAFIYDLAMLALPLCWLWEAGRLQGRMPGELLLLLLGWLAPLAAPFWWNDLNLFQGKLQFAPLVLLLLFVLVLIREKRYGEALADVQAVGRAGAENTAPGS